VTLLHSGLALLGLAVAIGVVLLVARPDYLSMAEDRLYDLLQARSGDAEPDNANTAKAAIAVDTRDLTPAQAAVANWLGHKYRVAPEFVGALVAEAYALSKPSKLPPHLILAVSAIESNFHPYVQSQVGAQGLMQVMTAIHAKRYEEYGGKLAAFDPITNLRVGTHVLQDCVKLKGGSLDDGLRFYLGGAAVGDDGGYVAKVRAEQARLDQVAAGVKVPVEEREVK
jgi:soluble lytic murein transglycosylase-like protein